MEGQRDMMQLIVIFAMLQTTKNADQFGGLKTGLQNWIYFIDFWNKISINLIHIVVVVVVVVVVEIVIIIIIINAH
jgi:hypothetical protein